MNIFGHPSVIQRIRQRLSRLPVKWKLSLWSTLLIFLLFGSYNFAQYLVLNNWMLAQEKGFMQQSMSQLDSYFEERKAELNDATVKDAAPFIENLLENNQMIRILDRNANPVITLTDKFSPDWIVPQSAAVPERLELKINDDHVLVYRKPLLTSHFQGTIEISNHLETFDHFNKGLVWVMVIGGLLAFLISGIGGFMLAGQFMRPVAALAAAIRNVKKKGLHERVNHSGNGDEFSKLAQMFNELMSELEQSFNQQKQFVEDASHELRTPVTILEGHLSLLNRWGKQDPAILDESLQASLQEVRRLKGIVQELLALTKAETNRLTVQPETALLQPVVLHTVNSFAALYPDFAFKVEAEELADVRLPVAALHVEQILLILLDNAVKYSTDVKSVLVQGTVSKSAVHLSVKDHGIGIPQDELPRVFDRFYRVDKARSREQGGTGLGLSIAQKLVDLYQGQILISSVENEGTTITITFYKESREPS